MSLCACFVPPKEPRKSTDGTSRRSDVGPPVPLSANTSEDLEELVRKGRAFTPRPENHTTYSTELQEPARDWTDLATKRRTVYAVESPDLQ